MVKMIIHAQELITCAGGPKAGYDMENIGLIHDGAVVIKEGKILEVGTTEDLMKAYPQVDQVIDATGKAVLPGFVDSHTHFVFGGYRAEEFSWRLKGESYMSIMQKGGGIASTVEATRNADFDSLFESGNKRLKSMLQMGVTTVEGKSGYGLDLETELKQLRVMKALNEQQPVDICRTFMGPHSLPKSYKGDEWAFLKYQVEELLPEVMKENLATFADIFCEKNVFSIEGSEYFLKSAKEMGLKIKIHADEIVDFGGSLLAAKLGCQSADHLLKASDEGIQALSENKVVTTLLPLTAFCLREPFADIKKMLEAGCIVALASDFNPGSCFTNSIPLLIGLACIQMGANIETVVTALTINGAAAIGREAEIGSIEIGKKADLVMLEYPSIHYLPYHTGMNIVEWVMKDGEVVVDRTLTRRI